VENYSRKSDEAKGESLEVS